MSLHDKSTFRFQRFEVAQDRCAMKVGTDGVLLGAWAHGGQRVLDAGTGTGVIALMMAQRYPDAQVVAIDVDESAVSQAAQNVCRSPYADRIVVNCEAMQQHQGVYDAVVSNPPFFENSLHTPDARRTLARHTLSLTYGELMQAAWRLLADDGELSVVVPFDYRRRMEDEATFVGFFPSRVCGVRTTAGKMVRRYLLAFRKQPCRCVREEMTIGDETYRQLTADFYL